MALWVFCADQLAPLLALRLRCSNLRPGLLVAGLGAASVAVLAAGAAPKTLATAVLGTRGASMPCRTDCRCVGVEGRQTCNREGRQTQHPIVSANLKIQRWWQLQDASWQLWYWAPDGRPSPTQNPPHCTKPHLPAYTLSTTTLLACLPPTESAQDAGV
jgi:hypothetical protein